MLIIYFYMTIIKTYKMKKNYLTNFRKDWNKFPNSQPRIDWSKSTSVKCTST